MRRHKTAAVLGVLSVVFVFAAPARAGLLGLDLGYPDVLAQQVSVTYTAATGAFVADGVAVQALYADLSVKVFDVPDLPAPNPNTFHLDVTIIPDGLGDYTASGGNLLIKGDLDGDGTAETLYDSDTLIAFGYTGAGGTGLEADIFEFIFAQKPGAAYAPAGDPIGVILSNTALMTPSPWTFAGDFSGSFWSADAAPAPEPGTAVLLGSSLLAAALRRRR